MSHRMGAERRQRVLEERRMKIHSPGRNVTPEAKRDAERMWRELPPDTRGLTARLCGDPIKGRSALDKRSTQ